MSAARLCRVTGSRWRRGLDEETCRRVNLGYLDHRKFDYESMSSDADTLIVKDAGRDLYQVSM